MGDEEDSPGSSAYWEGALAGANVFLIACMCLACWSLLSFAVSHTWWIRYLSGCCLALFVVCTARLLWIREQTIKAHEVAVVREVLEE